MVGKPALVVATNVGLPTRYGLQAQLKPKKKNGVCGRLIKKRDHANKGKSVGALLD